MEYAYLELEKQLKKIPSLIDADGNLLKQLVIDKIHQLDKEVISLVLKSPQLKSFFTTVIDDALILDKSKLLSFVQAREFIPNSFTEFTNTVGLSASSKFIHTSDSVVLDFPYKDCVLLGNQSKEENEGVRQKFFHEVINFQEINKLFTRKVMCDFVRHTINGAEEVTSFSPTDNLVIKGNNLVALHTLSYLYAKKVKLIYIDPPYNTESLKFAYNDKFDQATWLVFMKNRLEQAKQLLSDDGVIAVHIDGKQLYKLKLLMDTVFDEDNFVSMITVKMSNESGKKMAHVNKTVPKLAEFILVYKIKNIYINPALEDKQDYDSEYKYILEGFDKKLADSIPLLETDSEYIAVNKTLKLFKLVSIQDYLEREKITFKNESDKLTWLYENKYRIFRDSPADSIKKIADLLNVDQKIYLVKSADGIPVLIRTDYNKKVSSPRIQLVPLKSTKTLGDLWTDIGTTGLHVEGGVTLKNGKKPELLLARIISMFTTENDLVLDYHLGSGTTCAVAHKLGRQYIGIEQLDYVENDSLVRLNNVIKGDKSGISEKVKWKGGGSFVSMKLYSLVNSLLVQISNAKSKHELKQIIDLLLTDEYFIYLGIDSEKKPYEAIFVSPEFDNLSLEQQKEIVHKSIDKNNLYVDYDNLHDASVKITDKEKALNELFYKGQTS